MGNLYIDFSETYFSKLNTGIQRVVKNIISRKDFFRKHGFDEVVSVVQVCGNFYKLELSDELPFCLRRVLFLLATRLRNTLDTCFETVGAIFDKWVGDEQMPIGKKYIYGDESKTTLKMKVILFFRKILKTVYLVVEFIDALFLREQKIVFEKNDVLFLADAFWPDSFSISAVAKAKKNGVKVVTLIHDIFPITYGHLVEEKNKSNFELKFPLMNSLTDGYIFNSKFTQSEVLQYISDNDNRTTEVPTDFFHLGSDMGRKLNNGFPFRRKKMYLMVGTIEPRKNHDFVLRAFQRYWLSGGDGCLVIVGKIGWKCEEILETIYTSTYINKYLFYFNQVSDRELTQFYSNCTAFIFSSIVEGFGLPIVEAMGHSRIVLASDIPVFREIAGDYPFYFDLGETDSLIELLHRLEAGLLNPTMPIPELFSWDDSIRQLALKMGCMREHLV